MFLVLLFATMFEGQVTTNTALCGNWEILKDLCAVWSLRNVGLIYSGSFEHELRESHALKETVEKLGDVGVSVSIHKPPELLYAHTFTDVTLVAFIVLSQDSSTLLYLQQARNILS
ncbi:uncharacterized protein LOC117282180 [Cryptotermes secundus]|uniref:uncharacterized protein LOC117282180 n=1 Tax=Cryptotermes secundus TaxID=105785 RepID=UPI001454D911|nr:uncharacterized protein LOC117282180 [Cryptotermes secundus]